uniref:Uncharacterized protein n=1 Tax=viral metagenome TaxID=1070528 RepID=A0A6M3K9F2_9ZZZZ
MKLSEWLQRPENRDTVYQYVGEIWGPISDYEEGVNIITGEEWARTIDDMEGAGIHADLEVLYHPSHGAWPDGVAGYYIEGWDVIWRDGWQFETVLAEWDGEEEE